MEQAPYRPRRQTRDEQVADEELSLQQRQKRFKRLVDDSTRAQSSQLRYSALGFGYKDYVHGKATPSTSRTQLDAIVTTRARSDPAPPIARPPGQRVASLAAICTHIVAARFDEPEILDGLDQNYSLLVRSLLNAVLAHNARELPFRVWLAFANQFYLDLPKSRRTYRGLCVEDKAEIACLAAVNAVSVEEWATALPHHVASPPCFFLAVVDLRGDKSFGDADMWKLTANLASFLVVLQLDGTNVTDSGIATIARTIGEDEAHYERLEILGLQGLKRVTDSCSRSVAKLPSLRMLDLRGTSCTTAFRGVLNKTALALSTSTSTKLWRVASKRPNLSPELHTIELELFGSSYSHSTILTQLHLLAVSTKPPPSSSPSASASAAAAAPDSLLLQKPILLHLDAISRSSEVKAQALGEEEQRTVEELLAAQLALKRDQMHATFSRTYGAVYGTSRIARGVLDLDAVAEDKGVAFRVQDDGVAAGDYVGDGKTGGRATLYQHGRQKVSVEYPDGGPEELISDCGSEGEEEAQKRWEDWRALWEAQPAFYRGNEPGARIPMAMRKPVVADPSPLILLRHLPLRPPHERPPLPTPAPELKNTAASKSLIEGTQLAMKKRRKLNDWEDSGPSIPVRRSHPPAPPAPRVHPPAASSSSSSPLPPSSFPIPSPSAAYFSSSSTYRTHSSSTVPPRPQNPFSKSQPPHAAARPFAASAVRRPTPGGGVPPSSTGPTTKAVAPVQKRGSLAMFRRKS